MYAHDNYIRRNGQASDALVHILNFQKSFIKALQLSNDVYVLEIQIQFNWALTPTKDNCHSFE